MGNLLKKRNNYKLQNQNPVTWSNLDTRCDQSVS